MSGVNKPALNVTIRLSLLRAAERLTDAAIPSAALDARLLLQHVLHCDHATLVRDALRVLSDQEYQAFESVLARRIAREPVSHIVGTRSFWKDEFIVTADVLDPRPDSETLIEAMIEAMPVRDHAYRMVDLGTGSGCLLLSLLREYPAATGVGVEISEASARIAQRNADALQLASRATFIVSRWTDALQTSCDMIISNPPYIAACDIEGLEPEVRTYEPYRALSGGDDGLDAYRELMPRIARCLKVGGVAVVELGAGQCEAVSQIAAGARLQLQSVKADLAGVPRALVLTAVAGNG